MNMLFKICPRCGSKKVKWIIPQNWSTWECYDCDYTGPIIEGNEELSEEIREAYLESQKHPQENTDEDEELEKDQIPFFSNSSFKNSLILSLAISTIAGEGPPGTVLILTFSKGFKAF